MSQPAPSGADPQDRVVDLIASGAPLDTTLEALAAMVEADYPAMLCSILLADDAARLRVAAAPSLPAEYNRAVEGHAPDAGGPAWAAAAARETLVATPDIATGAGWEALREVARRHGLRACWAFPLLSGRGGLLGVFALYYRESREPAAAEVDAVRRAASFAVIAVERTRAVGDMRDAVERFALISHATNDVIRDWNLETGYVWWNEAYTAAFGHAGGAAAASPESWQRHIHPEDRERVVRSLEEAIRRGDASWQAEYRFRRANGRYASVLERGFVVFDAFGTALRMIGAMMDITERKRAEQKLAWLAQYNTLTGLPNRNLFRDRLATALERARRENWTTAVAFVDLDRFKHINDTLGHAAGDEVLKTVAERLRRCIRARDTVARLGGDEFTAVLENIKDKEKDLPIVAARIMQALAAPVPLQGRDFTVTASIGFAFYPDDGDDVETLLKRSDRAMYQAKSEGRNTYERYAEEMGAAASEQVLLEQKLRRALERNEFELHFQPIMRIADGRLLGAEALLRWRDPERGVVPPAEFIPAAESTGLIVPIGEWVLREACRAAAGWEGTQGVAVNLSARQFRKGVVVEQVTAALRESGLEPSRLTLEITETLLMENPEASREALEALRGSGVRIALDDFGTGYSSLAYLRYFALDTLKIDRSFVRDLEQDPGDATIIRAVIGLAHELRLGVTAEGVETAAQLDFLRAHGCDASQGYLHGRPEPAAAFVARLAGAAR